MNKDDGEIIIEKQILAQLSVLKSFPAPPARAGGLLSCGPPGSAAPGRSCRALGARLRQRSVLQALEK